MDCQEDVPLVCRIIQNVGPQIASLVGQPLEATLRGSNSKTATCNIGFASWSSDWYREAGISSLQTIITIPQARVMTTVRRLPGSLLHGTLQQRRSLLPITMVMLSRHIRKKRTCFELCLLSALDFLATTTSVYPLVIRTWARSRELRFRFWGWKSISQTSTRWIWMSPILQFSILSYTTSRTKPFYNPS